MCNPRRVHIRLAEDIREAWRLEVSRQVALQGLVRGEARVTRDLSATLNRETLAAIAAAMAQEGSGWTHQGAVWRANFDGGYCLFDEQALTLEIVAVRAASVSVVGEARDVIAGELIGALETETDMSYWDDGFGGHTKEWAEAEAQKKAQRSLDEQRQARLAEQQRGAAARIDTQLTSAAHLDGQARLSAAETARRSELEQDARQALEPTCQRAMALFGPMLARGMSAAMHAYAERNGARNWKCEESEGVIDISFSIDR